MISKVLSKLTYANVMVTLLTFVVLGGAAYATFHLPKNSVKSKNIVNGQVKGVDVQANDVAGTSRALVYDSAATTTHTKLATVKIGSDKWTFKGGCTSSGDTAVALYVNGPSVTNRRFGASNVDGGSPTPFLVELPASTPGVDWEVAGYDAVASHLNRVAGTSILRKGNEVIQVDYSAVANDGPGTCSIQGTVTPGA